ncbi:MAG: hypothetical protein WCE94_05270 [Candidatus Methanoperedens sp.]
MKAKITQKQATKEEIIHMGAMVCFDFYGEYDPDDKTYGWNPDIEYFNEIVSLTQKCISHIRKHGLDSSDYHLDENERYLNDSKYLELSIIGNEIEYLILRPKNAKELKEEFDGSDTFYTSDDVHEAIQYAKQLLSHIPRT